MLKPYQKENTLEVGIDECARGCLLGSVFIGAVILPDNIEELCEEFDIKIKDSKKMTRTQREEAYDFITMVSIDYSVISKTCEEIDEKNILKTTLMGMHDAVRSLKIKPEKILVDGDKFYIYRDDEGELIEHECVIKGDDTYMSIAAASILAKVSHDRYILKLVEEYPYLEKYDIQNNMAYGTEKHILAIKEYGLTKFHRKTFGICKSYGLNTIDFF
jgi:ribonuclease HII